LNGRSGYEAGAAVTQATFGRDIGIKMMSASILKMNVKFSLSMP
jgi:hypothetical protein